MTSSSLSSVSLMCSSASVNSRSSLRAALLDVEHLGGDADRERFSARFPDSCFRVLADTVPATAVVKSDIADMARQ